MDQLSPAAPRETRPIDHIWLNASNIYGVHWKWKCKYLLSVGTGTLVKIAVKGSSHFKRWIGRWPAGVSRRRWRPYHGNKSAGENIVIERFLSVDIDIRVEYSIKSQEYFNDFWCDRKSAYMIKLRRIYFVVWIEYWNMKGVTVVNVHSSTSKTK